MKLLRNLMGGNARVETELARREITRAQDEAAASTVEERERFRTVMLARAQGLHLGHAEGGVPLHLLLREGQDAHGWITGATGSGKTTLAAQLATESYIHSLRGAPLSIIVLGMQGNIVDKVLEGLGDVVSRSQSGRALLNQLEVFRFFQGTTFPEWQILEPSPHTTPMLQAAAIAEILETALGANLGHRQDVAITMLLAFAIEARLSLNELRLLLTEPRLLAERGASIGEPLLRSYFAGRFLSENRTTLDGIASRLDRLLSLSHGLRGALAGPGMTNAERFFTPGAVTLFDFSRSPLGAEGARRALGALTILWLAGAALSAPRGSRGITLFIIDEVQLALTPGVLRTLETLLATVRQFGVGLWFVNQSLVQLPRELMQLLATNIRYRFLGRSGEEDGRLSEEFLPRLTPLSGHGARTARNGSSQGDLERARLDALANLPERAFYYTERTASFGTKLIEVERFAPSSLSQLPVPLRTALTQGRSGRPHTVLSSHARRVEEATLSEIEGFRAKSVKAAEKKIFGPDVQDLGARFTKPRRSR